MIRVYIICFFMLAMNSMQAQSSYDSSFRFYYYDQKLSMFEQMSAKPKAIVWLGDSITDGGEWSELFPNHATLNRGISSDHTFGILNRLYEITRRKPAKVFILIGINDISRNFPDTVILNNYRRIIDTIRSNTPDTRIYIQSILPTNNQFTQFKNHQNKTDHILNINNALKKICEQSNAQYVNLYDAFTDEEGRLDRRYTNDGLHLTGAGYLRWKEVLLQGGYMR